MWENKNGNEKEKEKKKKKKRKGNKKEKKRKEKKRRRKRKRKWFDWTNILYGAALHSIPIMFMWVGKLRNWKLQIVKYFTIVWVISV